MNYSTTQDCHFRYRTGPTYRRSMATSRTGAAYLNRYGPVSMMGYSKARVGQGWMYLGRGSCVRMGIGVWTNNND